MLYKILEHENHYTVTGVKGGMDAKDTKKLLGKMEMFVILLVAMVSQMHTKGGYSVYFK
jgi:hypothetical protein